MADRAFIPPHITTVAEAHRLIGVLRGQAIYLKTSLGDYDTRSKRSVTLRPGHEGVLDEVYLSEDIRWKVRVKIIDPLAQPFLIWLLEDFPNAWTLDPNMSPKPTLLRRHERIEIDRLGRLMG
jgi:hypothetical protein